MPKLVWTNHVIDRAKERKIPTDWITQTINNPDKNFQENGSIKFEKLFGNQTITAVVKKNELGEDVIISCWIEPPNPGTQDFKEKSRYKEKQKAGNLKKIWLVLLEQIGL